MKKAVFIGAGLVAFAVAFLVAIVEQRDAGRRTVPPPPKPPVEIQGELDIESIDDLRVAGRKVLLCGVEFAKPAEMRRLVTEAARREFQDVLVQCRGVGAGTPCDSRVPAEFRQMPVVQCFTSEGSDLARLLVEQGLLCGVPQHAADHYGSCSNR